MKSVFVSYAEQDSDLALFLASQLRHRKVDIFINYDRMMTERFSRRAANEINRRDCVMLILSPAALASSVVREELHYALEQKMMIIPVQIYPIKSNQLFSFLRHTHMIDFIASPTTRSDRVVDEIVGCLSEYNKDKITVDNALELYEITTLRGHRSWVHSLAFSRDGRLLASASNDNTIGIWDTHNGDFANYKPDLITWLDQHRGATWGVTFSPNSALLASSSNDNTVRLWDMASLPEAYEYACLTDHRQPVYSLAFSGDGKLLASASYDNTIRVRDVSNLRKTGEVGDGVSLVHGSQVYSVDFSPKGDMLASACRDSAVRFWHIDNHDLGQLVRKRPKLLSGHKSWVNAVVFSPKGTVLATTSHDRTIRLWDTRTEQEIGVLRGHRDSVMTATFSPDGRVLASSSKDKTLRLWDVAQQREIANIRGHDGWVNAVTFSPDGSYIVTSSGDGTIKFWGIGVEAII